MSETHRKPAIAPKTNINVEKQSNDPAFYFMFFHFVPFYSDFFFFFFSLMLVVNVFYLFLYL